MEPQNEEGRLKYAFEKWIREYRRDAWINLESFEIDWLVEYHFKTFANEWKINEKER